MKTKTSTKHCSLDRAKGVLESSRTRQFGKPLGIEIVAILLLMACRATQAQVSVTPASFFMEVNGNQYRDATGIEVSRLSDGTIATANIAAGPFLLVSIYSNFADDANATASETYSIDIVGPQNIPVPIILSGQAGAGKGINWGSNPEDSAAAQVFVAGSRVFYAPGAVPGTLDQTVLVNANQQTTVTCEVGAEIYDYPDSVYIFLDHLVQIDPSFTATNNQYTLLISTNYSPPAIPPAIQNLVQSGGNIILTGTNNEGPGGTYHVLTSTNTAVPPMNWTVLTNGMFDLNGNFSVTNAIGTNPAQFYLLRIP
jgi:hypothetical protein